jgi:hypothetical protein
LKLGEGKTGPGCELEAPELVVLLMAISRTDVKTKNENALKAIV